MAVRDHRVSVRRIVTAGVVAGVVSGAPSTAWALATGRDPLEATRAAGTLIPGRLHRPSLVGGLLAHVVVSAFWTAVLGIVARRRRLGAVTGALAGLGIAALDLGIVARRYPAIVALDAGPQVADHILFGAVAGRLLAPDR